MAAAADWPQFRGPGGAATSADKGTPVTWSSADGIAWKTELPAAGTSSPILVGPRIILTAYSGWNAGGSPEELNATFFASIGPRGLGLALTRAAW